MRLELYEQVRAEQAAQGDAWVFSFEDREILMATRRWVESQDVSPISPPEAYRRLVLELRRCP
jgi:hypothetical protein